MHILLTNDDGPPHPSHSPYISTLISVLTSPPYNHTVSVVLPSQQRSWIGKAHLLPASTYQEPGKPVPQPHHDDDAASKHGGEGLVYGGGNKTQKNDAIDDVLRPTYLDPATGKIHTRSQHVPLPQMKSDESKTSPHFYALIPGTPATCTQLGLFHHAALFPTSTSTSTSYPAIDLVLSGPNHGRNTTAAFALSSGTLGGALEAAVAGYKAIALSFAFFTRKESPELIEEACVLSAKIVSKLMEQWDASSEGKDVDVYSINVPLVEGVGKKDVRWTWMLGNTWRGGRGLYAQIEGGDENGLMKKEKEGVDGDGDEALPPTFKWSPSFGNIFKTVEESEDGNDGKAIMEGATSVTPLKANFMQLHGRGGFSGVMKL